MEALHVTMESSKHLGSFKGVKLPNKGPQVSHLFFADDALFFGENSLRNVFNINSIPKCFERPSGLKINFNNSILMEVGIDHQLTSLSIGSKTTVQNVFFLVFLSWFAGRFFNEFKKELALIDKISKRLNYWKEKTISIGWRIKLIKSVLGSLQVYYMSLFRAPINIIISSTLLSKLDEIFVGILQEGQ